MSKTSPTSLQLSAPHLVAEALTLPEFEGFMERRFVAPPDHAAILIKDGAIAGTFKGANFSIGGVMGKLKSLFTGQHHVRVVLADLRPFSLQTPFTGLTKDSVEVAATATFELQVDPERATNALGLVGPTDRVGRAELLERFRPHLSSRAFAATISRVDADEIRGDTGLQDKVQADAMQEIERIAGDLGLLVRAVSLEFAVNAVERDAMEHSERDRAQARLDQELDDLKRGMARTADATTFQLRTDLDVQKLEMASEDELVRLALENEISLADTRDQVARRREVEALAHEIEVLRTERMARFESELAGADHDIDVAKSRARLREIHREVELLDTEASLRIKTLQHHTDQDLVQRGRKLDLDHTRDTNAASADHIERLAKIEQSSNASEADLRERERDGDARRDAERLRAEAEARVMQLQAGASMTPEQILAINAGLSKDVADVLAEQARANATGNDTAMSLMREMVAQATDARIASEAQAREMFASAMGGVGKVAAGAGGGKVSSSGSGDAPDQVECHKCGRMNERTHKFCIGCGERLRA